MDYAVINLQEKLAGFSDHWAPKIIAQMNDYHFKLAKFKYQLRGQVNNKSFARRVTFSPAPGNCEDLLYLRFPGFFQSFPNQKGF